MLSNKPPTPPDVIAAARAVHQETLAKRAANIKELVEQGKNNSFISCKVSNATQSEIEKIRETVKPIKESVEPVIENKMSQLSQDIEQHVAQNRSNTTIKRYVKGSTDNFINQVRKQLRDKSIKESWGGYPNGSFRQHQIGFKKGDQVVAHNVFNTPVPGVVTEQHKDKQHFKVEFPGTRSTAQWVHASNLRVNENPRQHNEALKVNNHGIDVKASTKKKNGLPAFSVAKIGPKVKRIKKGELLTDTELDDLVDVGHKIRTVKEDDMLSFIANKVLSGAGKSSEIAKSNNVPEYKIKKELAQRRKAKLRKEDVQLEDIYSADRRRVAVKTEGGKVVWRHIKKKIKEPGRKDDKEFERYIKSLNMDPQDPDDKQGLYTNPPLTTEAKWQGYHGKRRHMLSSRGGLGDSGMPRIPEVSHLTPEQEKESTAKQLDHMRKKNPKLADAMQKAFDDIDKTIPKKKPKKVDERFSGLHPDGEEDTATDQHIVMQLRRAANLGGKHISFGNGETKFVHANHAKRFLNMYSDSDHPGKEKLQKSAGRSHANLLDTIGASGAVADPA